MNLCRCETCDHCNKKRVHTKYDNYDTYEFYCNKYTLWIFGTAYNTIEIIGCASHSSRVSDSSSEPKWVTIADGSDKDWRLISMYELKQIEHAINEPCVGRNDGCPPGHLKEMHDSGNRVIDKVRSRHNDRQSEQETVKT